MTRPLGRLTLRVGNIHLLAIDVVVILLSPVAALALRVENTGEFRLYLNTALSLAALRLTWYLLIFQLSGLYARYWRYASVDEVVALASAAIKGWVAGIIAFFVILEPFGLVSPGFPRSIPVIDGAFTLLGVGMSRLALRMMSDFSLPRREGGKVKRILIAGAGAAGMKGVRELRGRADLGFDPVAFVDDDPGKQGHSIVGVPVRGTLADIARVVRDSRIDEVVVAMPSAPGKVIRNVREACVAAGVPVKTTPGLLEILSGSAGVAAIRDIEIDDLLRRGVVQTDIEDVRGQLKGTRILVTGAGGSIGSELCRQIVRCAPAELVVLEMGENPLLAIESELRKICADTGGPTAVRPVVADIRDRVRMGEVFREYAPRILYHAAAHKHVGLMEENTAEAVTNNVLGTRTLVDLALEHGLDRFVMISSDKAVNPTSVMGATKRVAELLVREAALGAGRAFVTVRFGNVLGSRGSVVPIFKNQIAMGGPVTVTDPEATRYFMTIPEAVQLVLQAASMGTGGEVFILDMGEPVKIAELARELIRLSGFEEGRDIAIAYTGLRPGEKLHEELFYDTEHVERSAHAKILVSRVPRGAGSSPDLRSDVAALVSVAQSGDAHAVRGILRKIVPGFSNAGEAAQGARPEPTGSPAGAL
ncbi:MAG TPA: nucleoside-diphosphate sugar epimerase/dehydratase [Bacteroidota bacterium]|nr:nucleoside-diphosphate sugar epimerase/dehydratase [Bacteroidota bacterium]